MNMNVDVTQALVWKQKVDQELLEVEQVLSEAKLVFADDPGDDTIIGAMAESISKVNEAWDTLCQRFHKSSEALGIAIKEISLGIERGVEVAKNVLNK